MSEGIGGRFSGSSHGGYSSSRLGHFSPRQVEQLHGLHNELDMHKNVRCELAFSYGHTIRAAKFHLSAPVSEGKEITVTLMELRDTNGLHSYRMDVTIDGKSQTSQELQRNISPHHTEIPEFAMNSLRAKLVELNTRDFSQFPSLRRDGVVQSIAEWQRKPV